MSGDDQVDTGQGNVPEAATTLISLTRLRLASPRFLPLFAWFAIRSGWQARGAPGFRGMRLLADRRMTFWTASAWEDRTSMLAFRDSGVHRIAMRHLANWCDEASVTHWKGTVASMQDWTGAHARMVSAGTAIRLKHPSGQQTTRSWAAPRLRPLLETVYAPRQ